MKLPRMARATMGDMDFTHLNKGFIGWKKRCCTRCLVTWYGKEAPFESRCWCCEQFESPVDPERMYRDIFWRRRTPQPPHLGEQ